MSDRIVDTLARGMATGGSRRALLGALGLAGVAAVAPAAPEAEAKKKKCSGLCANKKKASIFVRALHAAPMVGLVDVYVNGALAAGSVDFGDATPLLPVPVGDIRLQVTVAGGSIDDAVVDETFTGLLACAGYEIAVTNAALAGSDFMSPNVMAVPFFLQTNKTADTATGWLSAIHLSPNAPAVDVWDVSGPEEVPVFTNLAFGEQSASLEVPAGFYDLAVRVAGTDVTVLSIPGLTVMGRMSVQANVIGLVGEGVDPDIALRALPLDAPATCDLKVVG